MATENQTVEEVIIELRTNFEQVLKNDLTKYTTFVTKTGSIARSVEKSFNQLGSSVSTNMRNMFSTASKEINSSVTASRMLMSQVAQQGIRVNEMYLKTFDALAKANKKFRQEMARTKEQAKAITQLQKTADTPGKQKVIENLKEQAQAQHKAASDKLQSDSVRISDDFNKKLAAMALKTSDNFVKNAQTNLKSVRAVVADIGKQLNIVRSQMGMKTDIGKIFKFQGVFNDMKTQHAALQQQLRNQSKETANAEKQMLLAKSALLNSTSEEAVAKNTEVFKKTVANQLEIKRRYNDMQKEVIDYGKSVGKTEVELRKMADTLRKSISKGIRPSDVTGRMTKAMDLLVQYAKKTGQGMGKALFKNMTQSREVEAALGRDIEKLKEMREQAVQLQKTGLIDARSEIARIDAVLGKHRKFFSEFKKQQQSVRNILGKSQLVKTGAVDLRGLKQQYIEAAQEVKKLGRVQANNVIEAQEKVKRLESLWEKYLVKRKAVNGKVKQLQAQLHQVEVAMAQTKSKKLLAEYERYRSKLMNKLKLVSNALQRTWIPQVSAIKSSYAQIGAAVERIQKRIGDQWLKNRDYIDKNFRSIEKHYNSLISKTEKLSQKRFVSKSAILEAQNGFRKIKDRAAAYEKQILDIQIEIKKLESLHRRGMGGPGIQKQTEQLRKNAAAMRKYTQQMNVYATQAQRNIDRLHKRTLRGVIGSTWEMVRNFRWQVAAVLYLVVRAVNTVKRVFFNVMDEIAKYRREAMTLAAQFSFKMLGDMRKNFDGVYQYSRQLMNKMEQVAASTILTMEDMTMLVRTFAQAGFIPDPQKDVDKIAVIGTAIKTLTEGMANAGTQMRQELYAIIAGRQRATDQLAMMFQMMGTDIQKIISDARAGSVFMIDSLSKALKPFSVLNEKLATEWEAILNKMKLAWQVIKRIGLEDALLTVTKKFNEFASKYYDVTTGITKEGRKIAASIRTVFEVLMGIIGTIKIALIVVFNVVKMVVTEIGRMGLGLTTATENVRNLSDSMRGVLGSAEMILKMFWLIDHTLRAINVTVMAVYSSLNYIWHGLGGLVEMLIGSLQAAMTLDTSMLEEGYDRIQKAYDEMAEAGKAFADLPKNAGQGLTAIEDTITNISKILDDMGKKQIGIQGILMLPYDPRQLVDQVSKWQNKIDQAELAGLGTVQRAKREYEQRMEEIEKVRHGLEVNIEKIYEYNAEVLRSGISLTEEDEKRLRVRLEGHENALAKMVLYEKYAARDRDKVIAEFYDKEEKRMAQQLRQAETFMVEISNRPQTMEEQTTKWFEIMQLRLGELAVTNKFVGDKLEEYEKALAEGLKIRKKQDAKKIAEQYEALVNQVTSHRVSDEFEKINLEMEKVNNKIINSINFLGDQKKALLDLVAIAKKERIELVLIEQAYQANAKALDVMAAKASYLMDSYSPSDQLKGEIMELNNAHKQSLIEIEKELDIINKKYKDEQGIWKDNTKHMEKYADALKQEYREIQKAFERDLWRKQHPLWNELIEMSNTWADGLSDSLTDLVLDFENFGESIKSLWESIIRDMVKATIRMKLIDPLMSGLGSGESGSPTPYQRMQSAGSTIASATGKMSANAGQQASALDMLIGSGNPIPVYIVETPSLDILSAGMEKNTLAVATKGDETKQAVENGFQSNGAILNNLASVLAASNANNGASDVLSWVSMFSGGGGGGMNTGAPIHVGANGTTAFGMAEGGTISEHVVGRGLRSGQVYEFGERSKYGEYEDVIPKGKMPMGGSGQSITMSMPINITAIDTVSGVDFIMKHQKTIESNMMRSMKNNKAIRGMIRQS